jgi:hypothetical protein
VLCTCLHRRSWWFIGNCFLVWQLDHI